MRGVRSLGQHSAIANKKAAEHVKGFESRVGFKHGNAGRGAIQSVIVPSKDIENTSKCRKLVSPSSRCQISQVCKH
jgi:hypothetical protein